MSGKLIAIGGSENKGVDNDLFIIHKNNPNYTELGILKKIVHEAGGPESHIEIVTTASAIPNEIWRGYLRAFSRIGCKNVLHMRIRRSSDADQDEIIDRLKRCKVVMFSGGDQTKISSVFGGTNFLNIMKSRYTDDDIIIAGTSAGAMAMSGIMIYKGNSAHALLKGEVKSSTGLGLTEHIIDSHVDRRGRFTRLAQMVSFHPSKVGIGIGEDTGIIVTGNNELEVIGSGNVIIVDGSKIISNVASIDNGSPIFIDDLRVCILQKGNRFNLENKKVLNRQDG